MLTLVIADAELELVPKELWNAPDSKSYSKRRTKPLSSLLLDSNYLHHAIDAKYPGESKRRGRPDILHALLLTCQESILNKVGQLELFIHTREDKVIIVNRETRIPRSFNRFSGLIEDMFAKRKIQSGGVTLLEMIDSTLMDFIFSRGMKNVRVFSPTGKKSTVSEAVGDEIATTVVIGGFSEGDFRTKLDDLGKQYSIYPEELTIWTVAMEAICTYERLHGIMQ